MRHILSVTEQVAILFLLIGAGAAASKARMIKRDGTAQITSLVFYFVTPCAIIKAFAGIERSPELIADLLRVAVLASAATLLGMLIAHPVFRKETASRSPVLRMAAAFPNCGFMGIPLASALLGDESVAYLSIYMVVFHLFTWTAGIRLFRPEERLSARALLLNPGVIGLSGGVLVLLYGGELPRLISAPIDSMAALNTPLAMIIMGFHIASASLRPGKNTLPILLAIGIRQMLIPLAVLGAAWIMGLRGLWFMAAMVACAGPPAVNTIMFAQKFDADAPLGAVLLTWANLLSIVTMPLLLSFCFTFFA